MQVGGGGLKGLGGDKDAYYERLRERKEALARGEGVNSAPTSDALAMVSENEEVLFGKSTHSRARAEVHSADLAYGDRHAQLRHVGGGSKPPRRCEQGADGFGRRRRGRPGVGEGAAGNVCRAGWKFAAICYRVRYAMPGTDLGV
eukprot:2888337-Rhodomonas_salina.6